MAILPYLKRHLLKNSAERLDLKYGTGHFDFLRGIDELAHYSVIAGYVQFLKKGGSILDIGCGEGLLPARIGRDNYSNCIGFDFSQEAVTMAKPRENSSTSFLVADMNTYEPTQQFDTIIFNEVTHYSPSVLNMLHRYSAFLKPDGIFILSNFKNQDGKIPWSDITKHFPAYDETALVNKVGSGWVVRVLLNTK